MTIMLNGVRPSDVDKIVALPCFRIGVVCDGGLEGRHDVALALHDVFVDYFDAQISFLTQGINPARPYRAIKATPARRQVLREALAQAGLGGLACARLYGDDTAPLGQPYLPYLEAKTIRDFLYIDIAVPPDMPDLRAFADAVHTIVQDGALRWGYQGFGFGAPPFSTFWQQNMPLAYKRFRTAVMSSFAGTPDHELTRSPSVMRRIGDYQPGIPDMGWRTYVGADYAGRLGDPVRAKSMGVTLEDQGGTMCITAGPTPVWGDTNAGDDISAYTAAYTFLQPTYVDREVLFHRMWGNRTANEAAATQGYFERVSLESLT